MSDTQAIAQALVAIGEQAVRLNDSTAAPHAASTGPVLMPTVCAFASTLGRSAPVGDRPPGSLTPYARRMRRVLDLLGITRAKGLPRPKMLSAIINGVGLVFVLTGGAVLAGNVDGNAAAIWMGGALIGVGLVCWIVEGVLSSRTTGGGPSQ